MGFDTASGLVYSETVVSAKPCRCLSDSSDPYFDRYAATTSKSPTSKSPILRLQGAQSLQDIATANILRNADGLRGDDLTTVLGTNLLLVDKLWRNIVSRRRDSLQVWKAFAHVNGVDIDQVRDWNYECSRCLFSEFPRILDLTDSPTFAWLSNLTLGCLDRGLRAQDLKHVKKLRNVRNIRVFGSKRPGEGFTDHVFQVWADAAKTKGAFPILETIQLEARPGGERTITHWALGNLRNFPALRIFYLSGYSIHSQYTSKRVGSFVPNP